MDTSNLFKDKDKVKKILSLGVSDRYKTSDLALLSAFYFNEGCSKLEVRDKLIKYCSFYIKNFRYEELCEPISKAINTGSKRPLVHIDSLPIYEEHLAYISKLSLQYREKKLLFAMYYYKRLLRIGYNPNVDDGKIGATFGKNEKQRKVLRQISGIDFKNMKDFSISMRKLVLAGAIKPLYGGENLLVCFEDMPDGETLLFEPTNFEEIGMVFDVYNKVGKYRICEQCHSPYKLGRKNTVTKCNHCTDYKKKGNVEKVCLCCGETFLSPASSVRSVHCPDCQSEIRREQKRLEAKRRRARNKLASKKAL